MVDDKNKARCKLCLKDIDISNMGESALKRLAAGAKHKDLTKSLEKDPKVHEFIKPAAAAATKYCTSASVNQDKNSTSASSTQAVGRSASVGIASFVSPQESLSEEIIWTLKSVTAHYSYSSSNGSNLLFRHMFPDSNIAQKFSYGETKCAYLVKFGLAPHFQQLMIKSLKESGEFVVLFDVSLNSVTQSKSKQLDVHIRTWRNGEVATRFLSSELMGHATSVDLQESLRSGLVGLDLSKIVQISMDGPNVNLKMYEDFQATMKRDCSVSFLLKLCTWS